MNNWIKDSMLCPKCAQWYDPLTTHVCRTSNPQASKPMVEQFHDMLHRDQSGLAAGLHAVLGLVGGYRWATESRGSYEWDDDRFHGEMRNMLDSIQKAADEAIDRWKRGPLPCCVAERAAVETSHSERTLRRLLAFAYSAPGELYGDDGELQNSAMMPIIDFVRDSVPEIERKIHERGMRKLAAAGIIQQTSPVEPTGLMPKACAECDGTQEHNNGCSQIDPEDLGAVNGSRDDA